MKRKEAAQHLETEHSKSRVADFFLSPISHPDMVMSVLIEKRKQKSGNTPQKSAEARPRRRAKITQKRASRPVRVMTRAVMALCVLMYISCGLAPNPGMSLANLSPKVPPLDDISSRQVEPIETNADDAIKAVWGKLGFTELSDTVSDSFMGRLIMGQWSGLALIDSSGKLKAVAREDSFDSVRQWMERYSKLEEENSNLRASIDALDAVQDSNRVYLEIALDEDLLFVKMGAQTLYKFPVVTGRGYTPRTHGRKHRFATPRGILTVKRKEKWPLWYPPSWHWTERGQEIPESRGPIRGVLGKYRLDLGNAYGIHGTRRGRIGRPGKYSHGCVRMNRKDLEIVYKLSDVGTQVFVY